MLIQIIILTTDLSKYFIVPNIEIKYILITVITCILTFIGGELLKPVYSKFFKDYVKGDYDGKK